MGSGEPRRPREREAEEDVGWECSTWSGEEGRRDAGGRTQVRELGARVRLACGLPWAVHMAGSEMRALCLGNKAFRCSRCFAMFMLFGLSCQDIFQGRLVSWGRTAGWCCGQWWTLAVVDQMAGLGSRPRTSLGPHSRGGAGGCPWTRESVFSWLSRGPFPLGGHRIRRWASVGSMPGTSYEM